MIQWDKCGKKTNSTNLKVIFKMKDDEIIIHIGKRLRQRRNKLGLSQEEVGKGVGIAAQQVQKYESARNVVSAIRLYQFARFLRVPVSYFYQEIEEDDSNQKSHRFKGMSEERAEMEGEPKSASDREALEVIKSFKSIKDYAVRKRFADMLRTIALKDI